MTSKEYQAYAKSGSKKRTTAPKPETSGGVSATGPTADAIRSLGNMYVATGTPGTRETIIEGRADENWAAFFRAITVMEKAVKAGKVKYANVNVFYQTTKEETT